MLQYEPDGTQISVQDAAAKMISISDNTATDMLINLVGRSAVEAALTSAGMANPALDRPFLTTREAFILDAGAMARRSRSATWPRTKPAGGRCWPTPSTGSPCPTRRR